MSLHWILEPKTAAQLGAETATDYGDNWNLYDDERIVGNVEHRSSGKYMGAVIGVSFGCIVDEREDAMESVERVYQRGLHGS